MHRTISIVLCLVAALTLVAIIGWYDKIDSQTGEYWELVKQTVPSLIAVLVTYIAVTLFIVLPGISSQHHAQEEVRRIVHEELVTVLKDRDGVWRKGLAESVAKVISDDDGARFAESLDQSLTQQLQTHLGSEDASGLRGFIQELAIAFSSETTIQTHTANVAKAVAARMGLADSETLARALSPAFDRFSKQIRQQLLEAVADATKGQCAAILSSAEFGSLLISCLTESNSACNQPLDSGVLSEIRDNIASLDERVGNMGTGYPVDQREFYLRGGRVRTSLQILRTTITGRAATGVKQ